MCYKIAKNVKKKKNEVKFIQGSVLSALRVEYIKEGHVVYLFIIFDKSMICK